MSNVKYIIFENTAGDKNISVVVDGDLMAARDDHPNWDKIVESVKAGDPNVADYFRVENTLIKRFAELTDRISIHDGKILWDGEVVHNTLTEKILALMDERVEDWRVFVNFMEKLYTNPNEYSRQVAYDYLMDNHFTITPEGNVLTYKGVLELDDRFYSVNTGTAIVNDVEINGRIPYPIGAVVRMPRSAVSFAPYSPCHIGLHVATFDFAESFGEKTLECEINPRDIVNVPNRGAKKMRVCRLKVLREVTEPTTTSYSVAEPIEGAASVVIEDPTDDAIHAMLGENLLCGSSAVGRNYVQVEDYPARDEGGAYCWTCLEEAPNIVENQYKEGTPSEDPERTNVGPRVRAAVLGFKRVNSAELADMQARAKRRKQNFVKYAKKTGGWQLQDNRDGTKAAHWKRPR